MTIPMRASPASLAIAATTTAVCLSVVSGWQRGGLLAERVLLVCVGVLLVVAAHLLPALCRPRGRCIRALGAVLWIGCMAATCYGHAVFFVTAQQHAGEVRAAVVPVVAAHGRNLAVIASDRASVVTRLARVFERQCGEKCAAVRIERATLTARLAALDAESAEVTRRDLARDRADAQRVAARSDPVAGFLTTFGVAASRVDLVAGMAFAVVLEGVACFCWLLALWPAEPPRTPVTPAQKISHGLRVTPVSKAGAPAHNELPSLEKAVGARTYGHGGGLASVLIAINDGTLRGTVAEIRKHLRCSQATATAVRKQLAQCTQSGAVTTETIAGERSL